MSNENRVLELLEELVYWTKEAIFPQIRQRLLKCLESPEEKIAYIVSDGEKTTRQVASVVKVSHKTISKWWKDWIEAGIAEPISTKGGGHRARQKFLLSDFGIKVPKIAIVPTKRKRKHDKQNSNVETS